MKKMENSRIKENCRQFAVYLVVGGLATLVEWAVFYALSEFIHIHYMVSTALAFVVSTFANWIFGRMLLFQAGESVWKELMKIYMTSIAGLLMNLLIMWLAVEILDFRKMVSKVIATGIVFFWNFLIRKLVIYKT